MSYMYQPKYTITSSINSKIAEIERIRTLVDQSKILPQQELVMRQRAAIEAVYSSTSIENNPLNKDQVKAVAQGKRVRAAKQDIIEVQNYFLAWKWLIKRFQQKKLIKEKDVLKVQEIMMKGLLVKSKLGDYRPGPIYIVDGKEQLRYQGPKSTQVRYLVQELLDWLEREKTLHPVLKAGIFHYEFVSIHPFSDGNGRTTRILTLLTLWLAGYDFKQVLVPDSYYWQQRSDYYEALNNAKIYLEQRKADLTTWLEFFTAGFLKEALELERQISVVSISGDVDTPLRLTADQMELLDFCQQLGKISLSDVVDILKVSKRTAQRRLEALVKIKLLQKKAAGPATYYVIKKQ
jgi:Fic family protein